jgi:putative ABC transport system permease protein
LRRSLATGVTARAVAVLAGLGSVAAAGAPGAARPLPDLLLTDRTATALGLGAGDTLELAPDASMQGARRFRIAGVYRPEADPFDVGYGRLRLKMHLPDLAALTGDENQVDRFVLKLRDPAERAVVAEELNRTAFGVRAWTSDDLAQRSSSTFVVVSQFHKAIGLVSMLAGLVFLAAIMVLKVEEMRRELGVLRLLGISRRTVLRSVLAIAAVVALLGSGVGIGLGAAAVAIINPLAQARYDTDLVFARLSPGVVAVAVGGSVLMGLVAGIVVATRIVRGRALEQIGR